MVEIGCPFCDATCRMDPADFTAELCSIRCDGCGVRVEFEAASVPVVLPLAA